MRNPDDVPRPTQQEGRSSWASLPASRLFKQMFLFWLTSASIFTIAMWAAYDWPAGMCTFVGVLVTFAFAVLTGAAVGYEVCAAQVYAAQEEEDG